MPRLPRFLLVLALQAVLTTSAWSADRSEDSAPAHATIFVADGAGDYRRASMALRLAITDEKAPLDVETFVWSHGYQRSFVDQFDRVHVRCAGQRLANLVIERRQSRPDSPVYLLGHSAGSAVILAAADALPPDSVDRIILLAPSVSEDYDLRCALHSARRGIDVFCSERDSILSIVVRLAGSIQGRWRRPAGCKGFRIPSLIPDDNCYAKLRHYPWHPGLLCTGHDGGHYGAYQQSFLRGFILPLVNGHPGEPCLPGIGRVQQ